MPPYAVREEAVRRPAEGIIVLGRQRDRWGPVSVMRARGQVLPGFAAFGVFWGAWGALVPEIQRRARAAVDRFGRSAVAALLLLTAALAALGAASGAVDMGVDGVASTKESRSGPLMNAVHTCFSACVVGGALATGPARGRGLSAVAGLPLPVAVLLAGAASRPLLMLGPLCALAFLVGNAWQSWNAVVPRSVLHTGSGSGSGTAGGSGGVRGLRRRPAGRTRARRPAVAASPACPGDGGGGQRHPERRPGAGRGGDARGARRGRFRHLRVRPDGPLAGRGNGPPRGALLRRGRRRLGRPRGLPGRARRRRPDRRHSGTADGRASPPARLFGRDLENRSCDVMGR
ncbi:hypothetical protein ABT093_03325 [Kitasatospora sp. NPDC002551]|uniref:hypothetical protein n=1 Tax=Kitasatospora sp. NPDC002551 TaxID=3154539 RepID=UPI00331F20B5